MDTMVVVKGSLKKDKIKNLLVLISIILTMALNVSVIVVTNSIKDQYYNMANEQSSGADLIATTNSDQKITGIPYTSDFNEPTIKDTIPYFETDGYISVNSDEYLPIKFEAVDINKELQYGGLKSVNKLPATENECIITDKLKEHGINVGDTIAITRLGKSEQYKVVDAIAMKGIANNNNGNSALVSMDYFSGFGAIQYKIILKDGIDANQAFQQITDQIGNNYGIQYPEGKAEEFLESANILFEALQGFAVLVLILSVYLVNMIAKDYVASMVKEFSIMKALGSTKSKILKIVLSKSLIISLLGSIFGILLGVCGSNALLSIISRFLDSGTQDLILNYPITQIIAAAVALNVFVAFATLIPSIKCANSSVLSGFNNYVSDNRTNKKYKFLLHIIIVIIMVGLILINNDLLKIIGILGLLLEVVYMLARLSIFLVSRNKSSFLTRISPINTLLMKNNSAIRKRRLVSIVILFALIIGFSSGIVYTVEGIVGNLKDLADEQYKGDIVVSSEIGITDTQIQSIRSIEDVKSVQQQKIEMMNWNDIDVKVKAQDYFNDNQNQLQVNDNYVFVSIRILKNMQLNVGDEINIAGSNYMIAGTFKTMEHNGNVIVVNNSDFNKIFGEYLSNVLIVNKEENTNVDLLAESIKNHLHSPFIKVDSVDSYKAHYVEQNNSISYLFYMLIIVLLIAGIIIVINTMLFYIKECSYSMSIAKALGATNKRLIFSYLFQSLYLGIVSGVIGSAIGVVINRVFVDILNASDRYNIKFAFHLNELIEFSLLAIFIMILSTFIAVSTTYKLKLTSRLQAD